MSWLNLYNKTIKFQEFYRTKDSVFQLTQSTPKTYLSIDQCLKSEIKNTYGEKDISEIIKYNRGLLIWKEVEKQDQSSFLKSTSNPLTNDELFAIFLYTREPLFYKSLSEVLNQGKTGQFNCYFQYLRSGFDKLKPLSEPITLYRGVREPKIFSGDLMFQKDDLVSSTSFTSSTIDFYVAYRHFTSPFEEKMIFKITARRNPKNINKISFYGEQHNQEEKEYLFPPLTQFKVTSEPYEKWCQIINYYDKTFECEDSKTDPRNQEKILFVDLDEIDKDYGPILTIDDGTIPLPSPSATIKIKSDWNIRGEGIGIGGAIILGVEMFILIIIYCIDKSSYKDEERNKEKKLGEL